MKCIVCDNDIRIDTLKQLFAFNPLLLCSRCSQNLILKSVDVLYDNNEWIRFVIERLNQGDIVLIELFKKDLQKALSNKRAIHSKIKIFEAREDLPYPWLEILVDNIMKDMKVSKQDHLNTSTESVVITVEKKKNIDNQIAIVG